jgi:hypothetical protein
MKKIFKFMMILPVMVVSLLVMVTVMMKMDHQVDYDVSTENTAIPTFTEMDIPFDHKIDPKTSLPFTGSAIIDIDNDGQEELLIGGGPNQQDKLFSFISGEFVDISDKAGLTKTDESETTFGISVVDADKNGFADLFIARTNGVWLYSNDGGKFTAKKLDITFNSSTTPLSVAISDINRDGHVDLYVAGYIKIEQVEGQNLFREGYGGTSLMLLNNGDNSFTDITESSGLLDQHNTFMGVFVDIDNDGLEDLVVAHDTGRVNTWKNQGDNTFKDMPNPNSELYGYPMGIAVSDYNNNGLTDFFFSNVGSTPPTFIVTGDLTEDQTFHRKWMLFDNQGGFKFDDVAEKAKVADYEFSWGAIFEDFNLDGRDDLVVSENYIGFPPHKAEFLRLPGRFLVQNEANEFAEVGEKSGVKNTGFSISPITADFNQDGYPDVVHVNIAGKSKAFISKGGKAGYIKVTLPKTIESIAAKLKVTLDNGKVIYRDYVSGEGLLSDQSHVQIFGLGDATATEVSVKYISGTEDSKTGSFKNETVAF